MKKLDSIVVSTIAAAMIKTMIAINLFFFGFPLKLYIFIHLNLKISYTVVTYI